MLLVVAYFGINIASVRTCLVKLDGLLIAPGEALIAFHVSSTLAVLTPMIATGIQAISTHTRAVSSLKMWRRRMVLP